MESGAISKTIQFGDPPFDEAPKYRALLDHIFKGVDWTGSEAPAALDGLFLDQNHPNPFARRTSLRFRLERPGHAELTIYDVLGREVAVLVDGFLLESKRRACLREQVFTCEQEDIPGVSGSLSGAIEFSCGREKGEMHLRRLLS